MNPPGLSAWLGYARENGRAEMKLDGLGDRVLLLGRRASELSTLVSFACAESGARITVLDLDGSVSEAIHGYFRVCDYRSFLYEAFHIEGEDATHGQLVSAAYSVALGLSSEEEAILGSALQRIAAQEDMATPSALFDVLGGVEGFRGFYLDKLKGRIGSLRMMEATRVEGFDPLTEGGSLVDFRGAPYPQAAELASALFLAKLLSLLAASEKRPDALLVTGTHRLFGSVARPHASGRLLVHLLETPVPLILACRLPALLDERLLESMAVRIYSSDAWNASKAAREPAALSTSYVVCDERSGTSRSFVPRYVRTRPLVVQPVSTGGIKQNAELTRTILEEIGRFDSASRQSVVTYLTPLFLAVDVAGELDRLHREGYLLQELKRTDSGPPIFAYTVTENGRRLLAELRK